MDVIKLVAKLLNELMYAVISNLSLFMQLTLTAATKQQIGKAQFSETLEAIDEFPPLLYAFLQFYLFITIIKF